jgi:hypothetical protein
MPVKTILASKFMGLIDVYQKLNLQNNAIYDREQKLRIAEDDLGNCKGIFMGKQRKELLVQVDQLRKQIDNMKGNLSRIVQGYGYKNVKEFMAEYVVAKKEHNEYEVVFKRWEKQNVNKVEHDTISWARPVPNRSR